MAELNFSNGYTRIPNELLEAICGCGLSGTEMRTVLYIIRRTYGYNRGFAELPLSEIGKAVGMSRSHASEVLKHLEQLGIIERHASKGVKPQTISVASDFQQWNVENSAEQFRSEGTVPKNGNTTVPPEGNTAVPEKGNATVPSQGNSTYKEINKDIKEREKKPRGQYRNVYLTDSQYDSLVSDYGKSNIENYIRKVDSHVQSTGRPYADYEAVIRQWLTDDRVKKDDFDVSKYAFAINRFKLNNE